MSKNPQTPRMLENEKHWYKFLLWGRLGYDPSTQDKLFINLIHYRFPSVDASKVFDAWQNASKIIPAINRFHWWPWDYMWWVEKGIGKLWYKDKVTKERIFTIKGYHDINHVIEAETQDVSGYATIIEFVNGNTDKISPLEVARQLETHANAALNGLGNITDGGNIELKETLGDIRSQAYLGLYWANKIRGAVALQQYRINKEEANKENAIAFLEKALESFKKYAAQLDESYEKVFFSTHGVFDWDEIMLEVEKDIEIARNEK
jgi:hypothetical protein